MKTPILKPLTLAIMATSLAGCFGGSSSSSGDGTFSLGLTDAPTDKFTSVNITFTGVALQPKDGERITFNFDEAKKVDLLTLQGGETEQFLNNADVPEGDYEWMRLVLDADNITVGVDGTPKTVFVPSGAQTGLKTNGFTVSADGSRDFTIDFDAKKSIIDRGGNQAGKEGMQVDQTDTTSDYILRPTLRLVNNLEVGSISGTVDVSTLQQNTSATCKDNFDGVVYVHKGADTTVGEYGSASEPLSSAPVETDDDSNFVYKAAFLEAGTEEEPVTYKVSYVCEADDNDVDGDVTDFINTAEVQLTAGKEATHDFTGSTQ